jgi:hypothetical protein
MWRVVLFTVLALASLAVCALLVFMAGVKSAESTARKEDRAGLAGAVMLRQAVVLLNDMVNPTNLDEFSTINTIHRERAIRLVASYNTKFRKGSK